MYQELLHFLPTSHSNIKVTDVIHVMQLQQGFSKVSYISYKSQELCVWHSWHGDPTWQPDGNPGDEAIKTTSQTNFHHSQAEVLSLEYSRAL